MYFISVMSSEIKIIEKLANVEILQQLASLVKRCSWIGCRRDLVEMKQVASGAQCWAQRHRAADGTVFPVPFIASDAEQR